MYAEIKDKAEISDHEDTFIRCYSGVKILSLFDVHEISKEL